MGVVAYSAPQARVRAKRSRLLPEPLWHRLLLCESLEAIAGELANSPYEGLLATGATEFEGSLLARVANSVYALGRFLPRHPQALIRWYARRFEVANLKTVLRTMHYRQAAERARAVLLPLEYSELNWDSLLRAGDLDTVITELDGGAYAQALRQASERYRQEQLPFFLEVSLDLMYFGHLIRLMEQLAGADRHQAGRFLGFWIDSQNLLWAYRYRIYTDMKPEEILNYTLHRSSTVDPAALQRIVTGAPLHDEAARLGLSVPADRPDRDGLGWVEVASRRQLFARAEAAFSGSLFHLGSVLAYTLLLESEVRDLITLVEGLAQGLTAETLRPSLIREVRRVHT